MEAVNKIIKQNLKGLCVEELPSVLWAYRMTARTSTGQTPFSLSFGVEAVVPVDIGIPSPRVEQFDPQGNETSMRLSLDLLEEHCKAKRSRVAEYKNRITRYYNITIIMRSFKEGDLV